LLKTFTKKEIESEVGAALAAPSRRASEKVGSNIPP
jgi:hypothetical protein